MWHIKSILFIPVGGSDIFVVGNNNCMEQNLTQIKVIVVGDSGVGKSSILFRFVNDEFNEFSEATLGAAFVSKVHTYGQDKTIRFQVSLPQTGVGHCRTGEVQVNRPHLL